MPQEVQGNLEAKVMLESQAREAMMDLLVQMVLMVLTESVEGKEKLEQQ